MFSYFSQFVSIVSMLSRLRIATLQSCPNHTPGEAIHNLLAANFFLKYILMTTIDIQDTTMLYTITSSLYVWLVFNKRKNVNWHSKRRLHVSHKHQLSPASLWESGQSHRLSVVGEAVVVTAHHCHVSFRFLQEVKM